MSYGGGISKHLAPKGKIRLARYGGLSPVVQTHDMVPVRKGYWAFIWPYIELFLIGSTDARGIVRSSDPKKDRPSRYALVKSGKLRLKKFDYTGLLWTRWTEAEKFAVERKSVRYKYSNSDDFGIDHWYLVDSGTLGELAHRKLHRIHKESIAEGYGAGGPLPYSMDDMEVFVPAHRGRAVGKPARKNPAFEVVIWVGPWPAKETSLGYCDNMPSGKRLAFRALSATQSFQRRDWHVELPSGNRPGGLVRYIIDSSQPVTVARKWGTAPIKGDVANKVVGAAYIYPVDELKYLASKVSSTSGSGSGVATGVMPALRPKANKNSISRPCWLEIWSVSDRKLKRLGVFDSEEAAREYLEQHAAQQGYQLARVWFNGVWDSGTYPSRDAKKQGTYSASFTYRLVPIPELEYLASLKPTKENPEFLTRRKT